MKKRTMLLVAGISFMSGYLVCLAPSLCTREYVTTPMVTEVDWSFLNNTEAENLTEKINSELQAKQGHVRCIVVPSTSGAPKLFFYNTFGMRPVKDEVIKLALETSIRYADDKNREAERSGTLPKIFK